jgi:hypothetical protein
MTLENGMEDDYAIEDTEYIELEKERKHYYMSKIRNEWLETIRDKNWGGTDDAIAHWWIEKVIENIGKLKIKNENLKSYGDGYNKGLEDLVELLKQ